MELATAFFGLAAIRALPVCVMMKGTVSSRQARQKGKGALLTFVLVVFAAAALVPSFPPLPSRVVLPPRRRGYHQVGTRTAWRRCSRAVERLAGATWNLRIRGHVSAAGESVGGASQACLDVPLTCVRRFGRWLSRRLGRWPYDDVDSVREQEEHRRRSRCCYCC